MKCSTLTERTGRLSEVRKAAYGYHGPDRSISLLNYNNRAMSAVDADYDGPLSGPSSTGMVSHCCWSYAEMAPLVVGRGLRLGSSSRRP